MDEVDGDWAVTVRVGWFDVGRDRRFGAMTVAATVFGLPRLALGPRGGVGCHDDRASGLAGMVAYVGPVPGLRACRIPCLPGSAAVSVVGAAAYVGVDGTEER